MLLSCSGGEKDSLVCTCCHVWQVMALCLPFSIQGGRGLVPKPPYWPCAGARCFPPPQQLDATANHEAWQGEGGGMLSVAESRKDRWHFGDWFLWKKAQVRKGSPCALSEAGIRTSALLGKQHVPAFPRWDKLVTLFQGGKCPVTNNWELIS